MKLSRTPFLDQKAIEFHAIISGIDESNLQLSPYNRAYLKRYLEKPLYNIYLSCFNLELAADLNSYKRIIDLGGGIGFNSAFIKSLGLKAEVIYLDIDPDCTEAAKEIHECIGFKADAYYTAELSDIQQLIDKSTLIISRDVIEHIYDLEKFFEVSGEAACNVHNTAAILNSLLRSREFNEIHRRAEFEGNKKSVIKERDHTASYLEMRRDIITALKPELSKKELAELSNRSRGLAGDDLKRFIIEGSYPTLHESILHSNTCDPLTGNWAERCLSPSDYIKLAKNIDLSFHYPAYNQLETSGIRKAMIIALNIFANLPIHRIQPSFSIVY